MKAEFSNLVAAIGLVFATQASAQVTFYEHDDFRGRTFTATRQIDNFERSGFNDRASSVDIIEGRWELCEDADFRGRCVVLRPGRYASLDSMGLNDRVSSVRLTDAGSRVEGGIYGSSVAGDYDRRRDGEPLYEATIVSVHAVVGPPEQRCWVEREQVSSDRGGGANVPVAIVGAIIGGVLGHQVGGGRGQDIATAGGAVAGAAIGANVGRDSSGYTQNVRRCANGPGQDRPEYWDVTYMFQGQQHRAQTTFAPRATLRVNAQGEPRDY